MLEKFKEYQITNISSIIGGEVEYRPGDEIMGW